MDFSYLFTSLDGRISRKPYWIGLLVMIAAAIVVFIALGFVLGVESRAFRVAGFVVQLALLYPSIALMAKRLHDRNRPTWWAAIVMVPAILQGLLNAMGVIGDPLNQNALDYLFGLVMFVVGVWFLIELGFLRGTQGANQYGPDPLEGRV
jgi:uncharacterized membrane protein YhaH (DUF805 family)